MIEIRQLTKRFGRRAAVSRLSLAVPAGSIYGLLGHNGAGKSTTIGILLGHLFPDEGETFVDGISVQKDRFGAIRQVGAIFEAPAFYGYLSGYRNLRMLSDYSGGANRTAILEAVEFTGLTDRIGDRVNTYSHGMRQRLALAQALLPRPRVLILDEPTDGLDPEGIHQMRALIQRLNRELGLTILLSSHLLGEVEQTCDHVGIMRDGRLLFTGDWRAEVDAHRRLIVLDKPKEAERLLRTEGIARQVRRNGTGSSDGLEATFENDDQAAGAAALLVAHGLRLFAFERVQPTLEQFYLKTLGADEEGRS